MVCLHFQSLFELSELACVPKGFHAFLEFVCALKSFFAFPKLVCVLNCFCILEVCLNSYG